MHAEHQVQQMELDRREQEAKDAAKRMDQMTAIG